MNPGLRLASRSAARIRMLQDAGVAFEAVPADLDEARVKRERLAAGDAPLAVAEALATAKALALPPTAGLTLGSDQVLDLEGQLFDKPADRQAARAQLLALQGRSHRLHSAAALACGSAIVWRGSASVELWMRPFSETFLERYLDGEGEALLGSVGAYRLEGLGVQLFERIEGDYFTVLGLPLLPVLQALRTFGALER